MASTSSIRAMYSLFSSATHHIFFPPRLQIVVLKKKANRFPAHRRCQLSLHRFTSDQTHTPTCLAFGRRRAHHGNDPLILAYVQRPWFAGARLFIQRRLQPFFLATTSYRSYRLPCHAHVSGYLHSRLSLVKLTKNQSTPQHSR